MGGGAAHATVIAAGAAMTADRVANMSQPAGASTGSIAVAFCAVGYDPAVDRDEGGEAAQHAEA